MHFSERRRSPRFPFHACGHLLFENMKCNGTVLDLSANGGLFIAGPETGNLLSKFCELRIAIGSSLESVAFQGVVVSQRGQLLGIEFIDPADASRMALELIIDMNLGVPQLLDRDVSALLRE